jgi:hypothetical protein
MSRRLSNSIVRTTNEIKRAPTELIDAPGAGSFEFCVFAIGPAVKTSRN